MSTSKFKQLFNLTNIYSDIFLIRNRILGIVVFLSTFVSLNIAANGLISIIGIYLFTYFLNAKKLDILEDSLLLYNPLLVGLSIGSLFKLDLTILFLNLCCSLLTYALTLFLRNIFSKYELPVLSFPFSVVSMAIYGASHDYSNLFEIIDYQTNFINVDISFLPVFMTNYLKSLGAIIFYPNVVVGFVIFLSILMISRQVIFLSMLGHFFGHIFEHGLSGGPLGGEYITYSFNYILVAMAMGGVFLVPSRKTLIFVPFSIGLSVFLATSFNVLLRPLNIPVFALPFNLCVIVLVFLLKQLKYSEIVKIFGKTPEENFHFKCSSELNTTELPCISLPFRGRWNTYQSFNDIWTHQGRWQHALDFNILIDNKSFTGKGSRVEDYFAFGQEIYSPINGYVVAFQNEINDNNIGEVNHKDNWGNYIILRSVYGLYILIAHLQKTSVTKKIGDYVTVNDILGKCGNSGYSPEPHIHLQAQWSGFLGDDTTEFVIDKYVENNTIHRYSIPQKNALISTYEGEQLNLSNSNFVLGQKITFQVQGSKIIQGQLIVKMCKKTGVFYFEDQFENKLYFSKDNDFIYFYNFEGQDDSVLKYLSLSCPLVPTKFYKGLSWTFVIAPKDQYLGLLKVLKDIILPYSSFRSKYIAKWEFDNSTFSFKGHTFKNGKQVPVKVELDQFIGFKNIFFDGIKIQFNFSDESRK